MNGGFDRTTPYDSLPALPPVIELETKPVLKQAISARAALAELRAACGLISNPSMLVRSIALQEAKSSSEIESIYTTHDELYRAMDAPVGALEPHTKEVLRYQEALWFGFEHVREQRPIDPPLLIDLCRIIKQDEIGLRSHPGTQIRRARTGEVVYTPPHGVDRIELLLHNLCSYIESNLDTDPLVQVAVAHYQFEAIHPFPDGNGRTGRVLAVLMLVAKGLLDLPVLYLSRYLIEHRAEYYEGLVGVTEASDWEPWIVLMLRAIAETATTARDKIVAVRRALDEVTDQVRRELPKFYSKELVELIFEQPYTRIRALNERGIAKRQTASVYLKALESRGILRAERVGREVLYLNDRLLEILRA